VSAVFFLDNVDAKALTIDPEEFDRAIAESKRRAKSENEQSRIQARTADRRRHSLSDSSSHHPAIALVEKIDVEHLVTDYKRSVHALRKKEAAPVAADVHRLSPRMERR
jgi:hypothetical protein